MNIKLEFMNDENVRRHADEPGAMFNQSHNRYVLLRGLSIVDLRDEWNAFNDLLRKALLDLFSMKVSEIQSRYGTLALKRKREQQQTDLEFGLVYDFAASRMIFFRRRAIIDGLIQVGAVPAVSTCRGTPRKRLRDVGGVSAYVHNLKPTERRHLIATLLGSDASLDELIILNQTSLIHDREIADYLARASDAAKALEFIAAQTSSFFDEQKSIGTDGAHRGSGRIFGWAWFAQYLSMRGIWLQPVDHIRDIVNLYPAKLGPIAGWMAVTPDQRGLADAVWSRMQASRGKSAAKILNVFLAIAQSSNAFAKSDFFEWPLVFFKEWSLKNASPQLRSTSTNHLFKLICNRSNLEATSRSTAQYFFGGRRIGTLGVDAFGWCDNPTERNTAVARRCLGRPVKIVPAYVRQWAEDFRTILPLYETKTVDSTILDLNTWLIFLLHLGKKRAPASLSGVERTLHVNDLSPAGDTFINFIARNFKDTNAVVAYRATSTLAKAWRLMATRDGVTDRSNPFDPKQDRVGKAPKRHAKSVRRPLDQIVMEILVRENRLNDFDLARTQGEPRPTHIHTLKNPTTGTYEQVFFPLVPIAIEIILLNGFRKSQVRWLDSGEGDELCIDIHAKSYCGNSRAEAIKGRKQGFLRVCEFVHKDGRQRELGMFVNTNKSGQPYEVPWVDPEVAAHVDRLIKLQTMWNPIKTPIPARDPGVSELYGIDGSAERVFPLFRNPRYDRHLPISDAMLDTYWVALLKHCEPMVEQRLGFPYPLVHEDKAVFDLHALRITTVTVLHEAGVSIDIIQALVGHSSVLMTWYYRQVRYAEIFRALNEKRPKDAANSAFDALAERIINEAVVPPGVGDPAGLALLQEHRSAKSAPIDVFAHGICPGGDCSVGGKRLAEGRFAPVFRPRACSQCRYRVTGPMFLNGLVHRLNGLMFEIKQSAEKEGVWNMEADAAEDSGRPSPQLRAQARRERECRDALYEEWCAELKTIKSCQAILENTREDNGLDRAVMPARRDFDPGNVDLTFKHVHQFELVQNLVVTSHLIPETQQDLPAGAEQSRDNTLYRILHHNRLADLLFQIDDHIAQRALDSLGDFLIAKTKDQDELQAVIDGTISFNEAPSLRDAGDRLRHAIAEAQNQTRKQME